MKKRGLRSAIYAVMLLYVAALPFSEVNLIPKCQIPDVFLVTAFLLKLFALKHPVKLRRHELLATVLLVSGGVLSIPQIIVSSNMLISLSIPLNIISIAILFILVGSTLSTINQELRVFQVLTGWAMVLAFLNILQALGYIYIGPGPTLNWYSSFEIIPTLRKSTVIMDQRGSFSSFLLLVLPFLILNLRYKIANVYPWRSRFLSVVIIVTILAGLFVTGSRSSWIATIIVLYCCVAFSVFLPNKKGLIMLIGGTVIFITVAFSALHDGFDQIVHLKANTFMNRMESDRIGWEEFRANDYLIVDYAKLRSLREGKWLHNGYLLLIFGAGLFGAIPVFIFLFISLIRGLRAILILKGISTQKIIVLALLVGLLGPLIELLAYGGIFDMKVWLALSLLWYAASDMHSLSRQRGRISQPICQAEII